jgi:hypothetical protein
VLQNVLIYIISVSYVCLRRKNKKEKQVSTLEHVNLKQGNSTLRQRCKEKELALTPIQATKGAAGYCDKNEALIKVFGKEHKTRVEKGF